MKKAVAKNKVKNINKVSNMKKQAERAESACLLLGIVHIDEVT